MATWPNATKNTADWYLIIKKGGGMTWEDATMRWKDADFTWQEAGTTPWSDESKNTAPWSNQTKN